MYEMMYCGYLREARDECYRLRCDVSWKSQFLWVEGIERQIIEVIGVLDAGSGNILPGSDKCVKKGTRYGILVKVA